VKKRVDPGIELTSPSATAGLGEECNLDIACGRVLRPVTLYPSGQHVAL
jgi:hypothetical protein